MPQQLMLDPSLLLSPRTFALIVEAWQQKELAGTILPPSFGAAALRRELSIRTFNYFGGYRRPSVDPKDISSFVEQSGLLEGSVQGQILPEEFGQRLGEVAKDDLVLRILVDEWLFLTSQSWIASRIRKPFAAFLKAGVVAVEWGGKQIDQIVAKTLKIPPSEMPSALSPGQRVRAAAKWIGVGGSSASALVNPMVAFLIGAATNVFLLLDP